MMKFVNYAVVLLVGMSVIGCSSPKKNIRNIELGMTPEEVQDEMGKPSVVRASKVFADGGTTMCWEYLPRFLELNPRRFWIFFENRKVVQWGEPGDFAGKSGVNVPVEEYKPFKKAK